MQSLTDLADQAVVLPLAVAVAVSLAAIGWRRGALAWTAAVAATLAAVLLLKLLVFTVGAGPLRLAGLGNPSGHTAAGAVVYGGLLALVLRTRVAAATPPLLLGGVSGAVAALAFGVTRLTVHSTLDVLVGAALGIAGAAALCALAGPRPSRLRLSWPVAVAVVVALALHGERLHAEGMLRTVAAQALLLVAP
jgi:hypothetical protein